MERKFKDGDIVRITSNPNKNTLYRVTSEAEGGNYWVAPVRGFVKIMAAETELEKAETSPKGKEFKLTDSDRLILTEWGHPESDFPQIEKSAMKGQYEDTSTNRRISWRTALKRLGRTEFLSGLSRAAFHASAMRGTIYFDFHGYFRECIY